MEKLKGLARSRKFWAALIGLVVVVLNAVWPELPLNAEQLAGVVTVLVGYILGVALEDGLSGREARLDKLREKPGGFPGAGVGGSHG